MLPCNKFRAFVVGGLLKPDTDGKHETERNGHTRLPHTNPAHPS